MAFTYKIHSSATEEYVAAYEWYEKEQEGLGEKFMVAVDERVHEICNNPEFYSRLRGSYRQANIKYFPFIIVYEFFPRRKTIHIAAIFHTRRNSHRKFRGEEK